MDTHIFLWSILQPEKVPGKILDAIEKEPKYGLSAISLWEIAMLFERKRIELPKSLLPWLSQALELPALELIPITPGIAAKSVFLSMHGDPADRLIAATAMEYDCQLATVDDRLLNMPALKTIK